VKGVLATNNLLENYYPTALKHIEKRNADQGINSSIVKRNKIRQYFGKIYHITKKYTSSVLTFNKSL